MKLQTTKKQIRQGYNTILSVGYCELQSLLNYESPFAYSAGVYGWSCDYYNIDGVVICTGYSTIGERVNYDLVKEYEAKAEKIRRDMYTHKDISKKLSKLVREFVKKAVYHV